MNSFVFQSYRKQRQREASKHGGMNSTSKIDSVARILFPLSFGLFNFAYWYSYFQGQKPFDWEDHVLSGNLIKESDLDKKSNFLLFFAGNVLSI